MQQAHGHVAAPHRCNEGPPAPTAQARRRSPLGEIVGGIEAALERGEHQSATDLIEQNPLAVWYGMPPSRLAHFIQMLRRSGVQEGTVIGMMDALMSGDLQAELDTSDRDGMSEGEHTGSDAATMIGRGFALRLQGRPVEALRCLPDVAPHRAALERVFDSQRGMTLFSAVQDGVTAMLAGDFRRARASLTRARWHVLVPHLAFLTRDAAVKQAMIEALYGDPECARELLAEADGIPRTESWAEDLIDAGVAIAASCVHAQTPAESMQVLKAVPLRDLGEMWPFYADAMQRAHLAAGDRGAATQAIQELEELPLPRVEGQGYTGSVLPLALAEHAVAAADLASARTQLQRADCSLAVTKLLSAHVEVASGRPREALAHLEGVHEETADFRALELQRLAAAAASFVMLGDDAAARAVIERILATPGGLRPDEARRFTHDVHRFASDTDVAWPFPVGDRHAEPAVAAPVPLTPQETRLVQELARGMSRLEIASVHYITLNTVKAHLRAVYRKLGVASRTAAVLEAERRGII